MRMKAMQYKRYGDPSQLEWVEIERPSPSASQLLVKVAASSVNPIDWKMHDGSLRFVMPVKFPSIPGFDLAGEVVEVGEGVRTFRPGDRLFALLPGKRCGACAEYAVVEEQVAAPIPSEINGLEAAAIPLAATSALQALRDKAGLTPGQRLLIVGASGGVGHFAVQIAKAMGAHVTGVCSTQNVKMVDDLGADEVIDYLRQFDLSSGEGYDVILDCVVSKPFSEYKKAMKPKAVYIALLPSLSLMAQALLLPVYSRRRIKLFMVKSSGEDLRYIAKLVEAGNLRPVIDSTYPLFDLATAHRKSQAGHVRGKIVIDIGHSGRL